MERIHALRLDRITLCAHDNLQRLFWRSLVCELEPLLNALEGLWVHEIDDNQDDVSSAEEGRVDAMRKTRSGPQLKFDPLVPLLDEFDPELDPMVHHPRFKGVVGESGVKTLDSSASISQGEELEHDVVIWGVRWWGRGGHLHKSNEG